MSLMDWKTKIFDQVGVDIVKVIWSLPILFLFVKSKIEAMKKNEIKGYNMHKGADLFLTT